MKVSFVFLAVFAVSATHAMFFPIPTQTSANAQNGGTGTQQPATAGGNNNNPFGMFANNPIMMNMFKQLLMSLLPKILANPNIRNLFGGAPQQPEQTPPSPPANFYQPPPMNMAMPPQRPPPGPGGYGGGPGGYAGGPGYMPTGDAFKEIRMIELMNDPALGLINDPYIGNHIPPPGTMYGLSLSDRLKDHIQYTLQSRVRTRRLTPQEQELIHLIGDPPGMGPPPMGGGGFGGPAFG